MNYNDYIKQVGIEFKVERTRQGKLIKELAEQMGVEQNTISRIEKGQMAGRLDTLLKLANALNKPLKQFM